MLTSLRLKTSHHVTVTVDERREEKVAELVVRCADARLRCAWADDCTLVVKEAKRQRPRIFSCCKHATALLVVYCVCSLAAQLHGDMVDDGVTTATATAPPWWQPVVWVAGVLLAIMACDVATLLIDWFYYARHEHRLALPVCALASVRLGRAGTLRLPPEAAPLLAPSVDIESSGGSLQFGPWKQHDGAVTLRLEGDGVVDGGGSFISDLCIMCCAGAGSVRNVTATHTLQLVARSPMQHHYSDAATECGTVTGVTVRASYYKIDVATLPQCQVSTAGSTTLRNTRLNGEPVEATPDIFMAHVLFGQYH